MRGWFAIIVSLSVASSVGAGEPVRDANKVQMVSEVYEFLPGDARIVPGHGAPLAREDMRWHIEYLAAAMKNVQGAVDRGLSLEDTVKQATMPEYRGYVLFDWVHSG